MQQGLIFLPEDKHLAEKKAKMLTKQLEIQNEIDRLNALEGEKIAKDCNFVFNQEKVLDLWCGNLLIDKNTKMSKVTAETILAKYSQDELKQYLGIII